MEIRPPVLFLSLSLGSFSTLINLLVLAMLLVGLLSLIILLIASRLEDVIIPPAITAFIQYLGAAAQDMLRGPWP